MQENPFFRNNATLSGLMMMQGVDPATAIINSEKAIRGQREGQRQAQAQQRMAGVEKALPEMLNSIDVSDPIASLGTLIAKGVPMEAAQQIIGIAQKQAQQQSLNRERDMMEKLASGQFGGDAMADGGNQDVNLFRANALAASKSPMQKALGETLLQKGKEQAKNKEVAAEAQTALENSLANMDIMIGNLEDVKNAPALSAITGIPNPLKGGFGLFNFPGSSAVDAQERIDQIGGATFLQAYETLKGGGQITEVEGKKATQAQARMGTAQSDEDYLAALDDFIGVVKGARERALKQAERTGVDVSKYLSSTVGESLNDLTPDEVEYLKTQGLYDESE
jgi:hypothetical protein